MINGQQAKVSVIMPTFNSSRTLEESISSVINQTYVNWELLITDDCSTDGSFEYALCMANKDKRIRVFKNPVNSGAGVSRNKSIEEATGKYIAFLDSDDLWHPEKLAKQISFMEVNSVALSYTYYQKISVEGELGAIITSPSNITYKQLLKSNVIGCLTAIYDQSILGKIYMPKIRKRQDMALWLKILTKIDEAQCFPEILAYYREGHKSLSSNKFKVIFSQWHFYRDYLKFGYCKSFYYFTFYMFMAFRKHNINSGVVNK